MQQLWKENLGWDEVIPNPLLVRWKVIYNKLPFLHQCHITRWTGFESDVRSAELHGFADASNVAYAAVAYLRVISQSGKMTITLLAGKSKVAPLTPLTVPRLELCAAVLLARLIEFIRKSCGFENLPCFCWTDSKIVLAWLCQHPSRWKTFVAHRVADVQARLSGVEWYHVPSEENPADCASRGLLGDDLLTKSLWWQGPPWLRLTRDSWPQTPLTLPVDVPLEEKTISLNVACSQQPLELASRFSTWPKLLRVTAYLFKFASCCKRTNSYSSVTKAPGLALTRAECHRAKVFWLKYIQANCFESELHALSMKNPLSSKSKILTLNPFLDRDGLIRVGGRLKWAPFPFARRHPVLLGAHNLVSLIIDQAHQRALHAGLQLTMNLLRGDFWIIRARSLVKARIYMCVACTRERAAVPSQLMGELPAVRITAPACCFLHCGLDYAGPVQVCSSSGRGFKSRKAYIALFICLATRAIYLELVGDYSTGAFLNSFIRFCSRRGLPQSMYCDNGTTFVGAERELKAAYQAAIRDPDVQNQTATDNIDWHFIPPSAPHFGGLWEAGVKSVKFHLRRLIGSHTLSVEEFTTLLCKVEACLNSRPIAPLTDSLDDVEALTPGHFLIGSALAVAPEPSFLHLNENRLSRWQLVRQIAERFWKIWQNDHVNTLQQRGKWRREQNQVKVGQLVLLRSSTLPPCKWEVGRVSQCHPGADGLTRVVTVRTSTSEFKRPIVKVCVLPVDCDSATSLSDQ